MKNWEKEAVYLIGHGPRGAVKSGTLAGGHGQAQCPDVLPLTHKANQVENLVEMMMVGAPGNLISGVAH